MSRVRGHAQDAGRDPASLDFAYSVNWNSDTEARGADGERLLLTGSPPQVSGDIKRLEDMGVNHLTLTFQGSTLEETFALLHASPRKSSR
jgi:alkanesulfonate monooxygenase SsuD/methylene tetrahydromethanopterin reductase-like flavin-dependent oxidoreductase (luciferase family)